MRIRKNHPLRLTAIAFIVAISAACLYYFVWGAVALGQFAYNLNDPVTWAVLVVYLSVLLPCFSFLGWRLAVLFADLRRPEALAATVGGPRAPKS
jgi:hypothetical protein